MDTTTAQFARIRRALCILRGDANAVEIQHGDFELARSLRRVDQIIDDALFEIELDAQPEVDEDVYLAEVK